MDDHEILRWQDDGGREPDAPEDDPTPSVTGGWLTWEGLKRLFAWH